MNGESLEKNVQDSFKKFADNFKQPNLLPKLPDGKTSVFQFSDKCNFSKPQQNNPN
jgi:hypothetical protein